MLLEVRAAQTVHSWENFIVQKLKSTPDIFWGGSGQIRSWTSTRGLAACPSVWRGSAAVVIGPIELKLGRCFTLMGICPQTCCGPIWPQLTAPNPLPDCRGKRRRAPKGLLPGEQPEQHKFVMSKTIYFNFHIFI